MFHITIFFQAIIFLCFSNEEIYEEPLDFFSSYLIFDSRGKICIDPQIKHIKLDIGLSYSAPMSQQWLSSEKNLLVFGFEPNPDSVSQILNGAIKQDITHGETLNTKYIGKNFFLLPCALGLQKNRFIDFYITKIDCGCCSIYKPIDFEIEKVIKVPVFSLKDFFDLFPFDTHPLIEYIKIDAQGADLDIVKSAGSYLEKHVVCITLESENLKYLDTKNSLEEIDKYMYSIGFKRIFTSSVEDPTFVNNKFASLFFKKKIKIFQRG